MADGCEDAMTDSPRTTQDDIPSTTPDPGPVKGTGEATRRAATYGETPLDPGLADDVASTQGQVKDGLVRTMAGQGKAEFPNSPEASGPAESRSAGNEEGPKALSKEVPATPVEPTDQPVQETDMSREQTMNDSTPPSTPEPDQPGADHHDVPDADVAVDSSADDVEAPSMDESSAPRDRMAGVLTFLAAPRRMLPPANRRMLDAAAITFALWVPIAWGYAIFAPRHVESASVESIPAPNETEAVSAAEPIDSNGSNVDDSSQ